MKITIVCRFNARIIYIIANFFFGGEYNYRNLGVF
jgi:hypothetical protein